MENYFYHTGTAQIPGIQRTPSENPTPLAHYMHMKKTEMSARDPCVSGVCTPITNMPWER